MSDKLIREYSDDELVDPSVLEMDSEGWDYKNKQIERAELNKQVQEFLAAGGTVTEVPPEQTTEGVEYDYTWKRVRFSYSSTDDDLDDLYAQITVEKDQ